MSSSNGEAAAAATAIHSFPLSTVVVEGWFNGLYSCVFIFTMRAIVLDHKFVEKHLKARWVAIIVSMYMVASIHNALTWEFVVNAFLDHGTSPSLIQALGNQPQWLRAIISTVFSLGILMTDCLNIWRCWVVWNRSWVMISLPIITTIGGTVCALFSIVYQVLLAETKTPGSLPRLEQQFSEPYFALSLSTGMITTGMIVFRVWQVQNLPVQSPDGRGAWSRAYSNITEIVIESAALNSASLFVTFVLFVLGNVNLDYMQSIQSQISGLAPTLILLRLAQGVGRPQTDWTMGSSLRFATQHPHLSAGTGTTVDEGLPNEEDPDQPFAGRISDTLKISSIQFDAKSSSTAAASERSGEMHPMEYDA